MSRLHEVVKELSEAMVQGRLDRRGETAGLDPQETETVLLMNQMIDALIAPMHLAGYALDEIAHGRLPRFVIDDYPGEYGKIKENINTLLAILYGLHGETSHLLGSIGEGKLKTRGNDWDYQGIWQELIAGVNDTLDAVTAPINEAGGVLGRLARYDLNARMTGRYKGEHAVIRKAMNTTADSLQEAIAQVSDTVSLVSQVGEKIGNVSATVSSGAKEQSLQLDETARSLEVLSESASRSADRSLQAREEAKKAAESIQEAKESMSRMVSSMTDICAAADGTASIVQEIDGIAGETGVLARDAVEKAVRMRTSSGGFGIVAQEIRKLSKQCSESAGAMKKFESRLDPELQDEFSEVIARLENIAMLSNLLGVNAAIEAAHVEGAGNDFKVMTDKIHNLASRSADAAKRTEALISSSVDLSKNGEQLIREIDRRLEEAVRGAYALSSFADEISGSIQEQTVALEEISQTAMQINLITRDNAASASESQGAAQDLARQVQQLSQMVCKFKF